MNKAPATASSYSEYWRRLRGAYADWDGALGVVFRYCILLRPGHRPLRRIDTFPLYTGSRPAPPP